MKGVIIDNEPYIYGDTSKSGWDTIISEIDFAADGSTVRVNMNGTYELPKDEISKKLGVQPIMINSALVSAQRRKRCYWTNIPNVTQPSDKGILLKDIIENAVPWQGKSYCLTANYGGAHLKNTLERHQRTMVAEPVRIGDIGSSSQGHRVYSSDGKAVTLSANGGGQGGRTGLYAIPAMRAAEGTKQGYVNIMPGECVDLAYANSKLRRGRAMREKSNCLTTSCNFYQYCGTTDKPVCKVENGLIEIDGKSYPIKIKDGCYLIRKLSSVECERLQTLPDNYTAGVSNTQRYRQLGNGWTVDVIAHILGGLT